MWNTKAPVVDAPVVDAPVVDAPAVDAPVVDAPVEVVKTAKKAKKKVDTNVVAIKIIVPKLLTKEKTYKEWDVIKNPTKEFLETLHESFYRVVV